MVSEYKDKQAMNEKTIWKNSKKVIKQVMKHWNQYDKVGKKEFEEGLGIIIENISEITGYPIEKVAQHTHHIIDEFNVEYKKLPDEVKGYEAIIAMLYIKYMMVLGVLK